MCAAKKRSSQVRHPRRAVAEAIYRELLETHRAASARGRPLLTEEGISWLRQHLLGAQTVQADTERDVITSDNPGEGGLRPRWDAGARRLWLGDVVIRVFRQRAERQTAILEAFEEEGWATRIDDPLARARGETDDDAKERLHNIIKYLNRGLMRGSIRFRGDGTGQGVVWEYDRRDTNDAFPAE